MVDVNVIDGEMFHHCHRCEVTMTVTNDVHLMRGQMWWTIYTMLCHLLRDHRSVMTGEEVDDEQVETTMTFDLPSPLPTSDSTRSSCTARIGNSCSSC